MWILAAGVLTAVCENFEMALRLHGNFWRNVRATDIMMKERGVLWSVRNVNLWNICGYSKFCSNLCRVLNAKVRVQGKLGFLCLVRSLPDSSGSRMDR